MDELQDFIVGDCVWWAYCSTEIIDRGIIESIDGDFMSIRLPDEGECKVSTTARKIDGRWMVHRSYQGYKEFLRKE
ncbi:MAG: hypothetical protein Q8N55_04020 [bacterium]|nr:hypothetical protein [bacterium]